MKFLGSSVLLALLHASLYLHDCGVSAEREPAGQQGVHAERDQNHKSDHHFKLRKDERRTNAQTGKWTGATGEGKAQVSQRIGGRSKHARKEELKMSDQKHSRTGGDQPGEQHHHPQQSQHAPHRDKTNGVADQKKKGPHQAKKDMKHPVHSGRGGTSSSANTVPTSSNLPAGYIYATLSDDPSDEFCGKTSAEIGIPVNTCLTSQWFSYKVQLVTDGCAGATVHYYNGTDCTSYLGELPLNNPGEVCSPFPSSHQANLPDVTVELPFHFYKLRCTAQPTMPIRIDSAVIELFGGAEGCTTQSVGFISLAHDLCLPISLPRGASLGSLELRCEGEGTVSMVEHLGNRCDAPRGSISYDAVCSGTADPAPAAGSSLPGLGVLTEGLLQWLGGGGLDYLWDDDSYGYGYGGSYGYDDFTPWDDAYYGSYAYDDVNYGNDSYVYDDSYYGNESYAYDYGNETYGYDDSYSYDDYYAYDDAEADDHHSDDANSGDDAYYYFYDDDDSAAGYYSGSSYADDDEGYYGYYGGGAQAAMLVPPVVTGVQAHCAVANTQYTAIISVTQDLSVDVSAVADYRANTAAYHLVLRKVIAGCLTELGVSYTDVFIASVVPGSSTSAHPGRGRPNPPAQHRAHSANVHRKVASKELAVASALLRVQYTIMSYTAGLSNADLASQLEASISGGVFDELLRDLATSAGVTALSTATSSVVDINTMVGGDDDDAVSVSSASDPSAEVDGSRAALSQSAVIGIAVGGGMALVLLVAGMAYACWPKVAAETSPAELTASAAPNNAAASAGGDGVGVEGGALEMAATYPSAPEPVPILDNPAQGKESPARRDAGQSVAAQIVEAPDLEQPPTVYV